MKVHSHSTKTKEFSLFETPRVRGSPSPYPFPDTDTDTDTGTDTDTDTDTDQVLGNQPWRCLSAAAPPLFKTDAPLLMLAGVQRRLQLRWGFPGLLASRPEESS